MNSRPEQCDPPHPSCTRVFQGFTTLRHRRAARPDVVDKENGAGYGGFVSNEKHTADVLFPLLCQFFDSARQAERRVTIRGHGQEGLGERVLGACHERGIDGKLKRRGERSRHERGLVVAALPFSPPMERDGNDRRL